MSTLLRMQRALDELEGAVHAAVNEENARGGEAREVVAALARNIGFDLYKDRGSIEVWSRANMMRLADAVKAISEERDALKAVLEGKKVVWTVLDD